MRIIFLLFIIAFTSYLAVFYGSAEISLLLLCEVFIPLLFFILAIINSFFLKIKPIVTKSVVTKGDKIKIPINITNRSPIPCPKINGRLNSVNTFADKSHRLNMDFSSLGFSDEIVETGFDGSSCGIYKITIDKLKIYDLFRLGFIPTLSEKEECTFTVIPKLEELPLLLTPNAVIFNGDSDDFHSEKSGDDPSEIFKIREYQGGDKIRSIHWKQSAKSDILMVKEMSLPVGSSLALVINSGENLDIILDYIGCLSYSLVINECIHTIIWCDSKSSTIKKSTISDMDGLYSFFLDIFLTKPQESEILADINDYPVVFSVNNHLNAHRNGEFLFNLKENPKKELIL